MTLDVETFNAVLSIVNFLRENAESRIELMKVIPFELNLMLVCYVGLIDYVCLQDILIQMNKQGLRPNIGTLNSSLESVCFNSNKRLAKETALQLVAEFDRLGVKPSLGTYYYLLACFCKDRNDRKSLNTIHWSRTCNLKEYVFIPTFYMLTCRRDN